jgi:hypothetical protein
VANVKGSKKIAGLRVGCGGESEEHYWWGESRKSHFKRY